MDSPPFTLVLSDIHCGGTTALLPPDFETIEGQAVRQTAFQKWLWGCWLEIKDWCTDHHDAYDLVVNGDAIEGMHHRTIQVWSPDPADHVNAAHHCLAPIADMARKVYVVLGTEAHTGTFEHDLADRLGAEYADGKRRKAFDVLRLVYDGTRYKFCHHISTSSRPWTEAGRLSSALSAHQLVDVRRGAAMTQVLGCGHGHIYDFHGNATGLCVTGPGWQGPTRYVGRFAPHSGLEVGGYVLDRTHARPGGLPALVPLVWIASDGK